MEPFFVSAELLLFFSALCFRTATERPIISGHPRSAGAHGAPDEGGIQARSAARESRVAASGSGAILPSLLTAARDRLTARQEERPGEGPPLIGLGSALGWEGSGEERRG